MRKTEKRREELKKARETHARQETGKCSASEIKQLAQKAFAALFLVAAPVIIIVVITAAGAVIFVVSLRGARGFGLIDRLRGRARGRGRGGGCCAKRTFDDFVKFATIQPDATAFGAIVDFHAATVGHDEGFIVYGAAH